MVTDADVNDDVQRLLHKFSFAFANTLKMNKKEKKVIIIALFDKTLKINGNAV